MVRCAQLDFYCLHPTEIPFFCLLPFACKKESRPEIRERTSDSLEQVSSLLHYGRRAISTRLKTFQLIDEKVVTMNRPALILPDNDDDDQVLSSHPSNLETDLHLRNEKERYGNDTCLLGLLRERDGRCAFCGINTHCFQSDPFNYHKTMKIPLTIDKEVFRGRCLFCHPITNQSFDFMKSSSPSAFVHEIQNKRSIQSTALTTTTTTTPYSEDECDDDSTDLIRILQVMESSPLHEHCQEACCESLWVYSWDDDLSAMIGRLGGIKRIIRAMINFPEHKLIQLCACGALENLSCNSYNRSLVGDLGGAVQLVQTMLLHSNSICIQKSCCMAMASLAQSPKIRKEIIEAGGRHAILQSLQTFKHDASLLVYHFIALDAFEDDSLIPQY